MRGSTRTDETNLSIHKTSLKENLLTPWAPHFCPAPILKYAKHLLLLTKAWRKWEAVSQPSIPDLAKGGRQLAARFFTTSVAYEGHRSGATAVPTDNEPPRTTAQMVPSGSGGVSGCSVISSLSSHMFYENERLDPHFPRKQGFAEDDSQSITE